MKTVREDFVMRGEIHHAHLVVGDLLNSEELVDAFMREVLHADPVRHPDVVRISADRLGIDESKNIRALAYSAPIAGTHRFCVIQAPAMTPEAQNALLKIFEEPPAQTIFFVLVRSIRAVLGTVRSRMRVVRGGDEALLYIPLAKTFLQTPAHERTALLSELLQGYDDADERGAVRERVRRFTGTIESMLREYAINRKETVAREALRDVHIVQEYIEDPASLPRFLVEHLSLVLPVFKG